MTHAIPTHYRGVQFRSRLEARWAAMFDLLDWRWEYEPVDLEGYIPDFVLMVPRGLVLVEIKPAFSYDALERAAAKKIDKSGWVTTNPNSALIFGATWNVGRENTYDLIAGALNQKYDEWSYESWDAAVWHSCPQCPLPSLCSQTGSYTCVICGHYDGHCGDGDEAVVRELWAEAGNAVQWKAPRRR